LSRIPKFLDYNPFRQDFPAQTAHDMDADTFIEGKNIATSNNLNTLQFVPPLSDYSYLCPKKLSTGKILKILSKKK
jgi:hypothetical protein